MSLLTPVPAATSDAAPAAAGRRIDLRRWCRYAGVSAVSTAISLTVLGILVGVVGLSATWSNVIATAIGTVPSFELNRRWVWHHTGRRSLVRQVTPFVTLSFAGLVLSTLAVRAAAAATSDWPSLWHTAAVELANLSAYGALWLVQFFVLDHFLFAGRQGTTGQGDAVA